MKKIYTLVSVVQFEVDNGRLSEVSNISEAFEEEIVNISKHEVILTNPDGTQHENPFDIMAIKHSIENGLKTGGF